MARPSESRTAQQLHEVHTGIEVWRWTRQKRSPMPEELWAQAARLAEDLGVWRVARDLGLCYESLKRRVDEKASRKAAGTVRFVEVRGTDLRDTANGGGTVVELHASDGTRMTVRLVSGTQVDLQALVTAFRQEAG